MEGVENGGGDTKNTGQHGEAFETAERNEEAYDAEYDRENRNPSKVARRELQAIDERSARNEDP